MGKFVVINTILKNIRQHDIKLKYEIYWELWKLGSNCKESTEAHMIKIVLIVMLKLVWSGTHQI
jgi:uncharacterized protein YcfL